MPRKLFLWTVLKCNLNSGMMFSLPLRVSSKPLKIHSWGSSRAGIYLRAESFAMKSMALINYPGRLWGTSETYTYLAIVSLHAPFGLTHIQRGIVQSAKQKSASGPHSGRGTVLARSIPLSGEEKKKNQTEA